MHKTVRAWKTRASQLKSETYALYLAYRDPRVPWYAKAFAAFVVAYALSPIDLIPDFVPVLGHLDDLILVPLGIAVAIKMIPAPVLAECRQRAQDALDADRYSGWIAAVVVVSLWLVAAAALAYSILELVGD